MDNSFEPDDRWRPWTPVEVASRWRDWTRPWYVAGGWAIDLFLGQQTREHEDIEVGVPAAHFADFAQRLADCELFVVGSGRAAPLATASEAALAEHHQIWVRDTACGVWRLDVFREPERDGQWVARRDPRIRLDYRHLILETADGIPFARPEVILLFKAKARRDKDEADFSRVLPRLDRQARDWLREALGLAHPGHPWIEVLRDAATN